MLASFVETAEGRVDVSTSCTMRQELAGHLPSMNIYDEAMGLYESELVSSADTLLLGRVTYQSFAGSWPHVPDNPGVVVLSYQPREK